MKKVSLLGICLVLIVSYTSYGIGISPARWTTDMPENGERNYSLTYNLSAPTTQYSSFTVYDPAGLDVSITGCSSTDGIEYVNENTFYIDWNVIGTQSVSAYVNVRIPEVWNTSVEPGGSYFGDLTRHSELSVSSSGVSAICAVVSQINFFRNCAPTINLMTSTNPSSINQAANLTVQFNDKTQYWTSRNVNNEWFFYEIDWESDGIIDQSGGATFDEEATQHPTNERLFMWTSGVQTSTLSLDHIYDEAGEYLVTINVTDYGVGETASIQVPITVVPEPMTLSILGIGGLFLRKKW